MQQAMKRVKDVLIKHLALTLGWTALAATAFGQTLEKEFLRLLALGERARAFRPGYQQEVP
jgi:hypothetical protein